LEAEVGIGRFSPRLQVKNAHFSEQININLPNQIILILTVLVSVQVMKQIEKFLKFECHSAEE